MTLFGDKPDFDARFEAFWKSAIFRKLGKDAAKRHLRTTVKTDVDWIILQQAHDAYKRDLAAHPRELLHGSTFCNRWRDFLEPLEPQAPTEPYAPAVQEILEREDKPPDWDPEWCKEFLNELKAKTAQ